MMGDDDAAEGRSGISWTRPRIRLKDQIKSVHRTNNKKNLRDIIIVIVATPKRAQTTKMERPAGVIGETSPGRCYPYFYELNTMGRVTYHIRLW